MQAQTAAWLCCKPCALKQRACPCRALPQHSSLTCLSQLQRVAAFVVDRTEQVKTPAAALPSPLLQHSSADAAPLQLLLLLALLLLLVPKLLLSLLLLTLMLLSLPPPQLSVTAVTTSLLVMLDDLCRVPAAVCGGVSPRCPREEHGNRAGAAVWGEGPHPGAVLWPQLGGRPGHSW